MSSAESKFVVKGLDITQPHKDWVGKCSPAPAKKNALFWRAFHIVDDERNGRAKLLACCNICGHTLISHNSGTTNLRRHIASQHIAVYDRLIRISEAKLSEKTEYLAKRKLVSQGREAATKRPKKLPSTNVLDRPKKAAAMLCVATLRPFSTCDQPEFQELVKACISVGNAGFNYTPKSQAIQSTAEETARQGKESLKTMLGQADSLVATVDHRESRCQGSRTTLNIRWISHFRLRSCTLATVYHNGSRPSMEILDMLLEELEKWDLLDRIHYVVTNLQGLDDQIQKDFKAQPVRCLDGLLQQVIESSVCREVGPSHPDGNEEEGKVVRGDFIRKARKVASEWQSPTPPAVASADTSNESTDIPSGGPTEDTICRWWSTFEMVDGLLDRKHLLDRPSSATIPNESDWEGLELLQTLLKPIANPMKMLHGNHHCTSSLVPFILYVVRNELKRLIANPSGPIESTAAELLGEFEQKLGDGLSFSEGTQRAGLDKAILFAHALDPRFKQLKVLDIDETKEKLWSMLLDEMVVQREKSKLKKDVGEAASILTGVAQKVETKSDTETIFDQYAGVLDGAEKEPDCRFECQKELKLYRAESTSGMRTVNGKEDPLSWWKSHQVTFPTLWKLASMYLAIPATSAPPDIAFVVESSSDLATRSRRPNGWTADVDLLRNNLWILEES